MQVMDNKNKRGNSCKNLRVRTLKTSKKEKYFHLKQDDQKRFKDECLT